MPETGSKIPPEAAFKRFLREKHERGEKKYEHISGRIAVENLPSDHLYRWIAEWMNLQLSDVGVTSTGGVALPPLHFELVRVNNGIAAAHTFEAVEWGFIVMTQPMFDEMLRLSRLVVSQNAAFFSLQIAPSADAEKTARLLLLMQFCFVSAHEYSHLVPSIWRIIRPMPTSSEPFCRKRKRSMPTGTASITTCRFFPVAPVARLRRVC